MILMNNLAIFPAARARATQVRVRARGQPARIDQALGSGSAAPAPKRTELALQDS